MTLWIRRVFLANLILQVMIILTGGIVRLTGSGLGCTTAPQCVPGSILPLADQNEGLRTAIEFGNRTFSVLVGIVAAAAVAAAVMAALRHGYRKLMPLATGVLVLTVTQAILGAITVRTGLHPATVMAHFLISAVIVALSTLLYVRSGQGLGPSVTLVRREVSWVGNALGAVLAVVVVAGTVTTGTGPHAGDADNPPRFDLDLPFTTHLHAESGIAFAVLAVALAVLLRVTDGPRAARNAARWLLWAVALQVAVGYLQVLTGLPIPLVAVHMVTAALLVVATVTVLAQLRVPQGESEADVQQPAAAALSESGL